MIDVDDDNGCHKYPLSTSTIAFRTPSVYDGRARKSKNEKFELQLERYSEPSNSLCDDYDCKVGIRG